MGRDKDVVETCAVFVRGEGMRGSRARWGDVSVADAIGVVEGKAVEEGGLGVERLEDPSTIAGSVRIGGVLGKINFVKVACDDA